MTRREKRKRRPQRAQPQQVPTSGKPDARAPTRQQWAILVGAYAVLSALFVNWGVVAHHWSKVNSLAPWCVGLGLILFDLFQPFRQRWHRFVFDCAGRAGAWGRHIILLAQGVAICVLFLLFWGSLDSVNYVAAEDDGTKDKRVAELAWHEPWNSAVSLSVTTLGRFNVWSPRANVWSANSLPKFDCIHPDGQAAPAQVERSPWRVSCPPPKPECPDGMVALPGGTFEMGTKRDQNLYELCVSQKAGDEVACRQQESRQVERARPRTIKPFCIDQKEVSRSEFVKWVAERAVTRTQVTCGEPPGAYHFAEMGGIRLVIASEQDPWHTLAFASEHGARPLEHGDLPVVGVTWEAAQKYCSDNHRRLPTEEEWEYAARGPAAREYVGDRPPSCARLDPLSPSQPIFGHPVSNATGLPDTLCPNILGPQPVGYQGDRSWAGVLQLAGNASEWTATAAEPRAGRPGDFYVYKGGSWQDSRFWIRAASVSYGESLCPSATIGFRCAADPAAHPAQKAAR